MNIHEYQAKELLKKYNVPDDAEERNLYEDIDSAILKLVRNGNISTLPRFIKSNPLHCFIDE